MDERALVAERSQLAVEAAGFADRLANPESPDLDRRRHDRDLENRAHHVVRFAQGHGSAVGRGLWTARRRSRSGRDIALLSDLGRDRDRLFDGASDRSRRQRRAGDVADVLRRK